MLLCQENSGFSRFQYHAFCTWIASGGWAQIKRRNKDIIWHHEPRPVSKQFKNHVRPQICRYSHEESLRFNLNIAFACSPQLTTKGGSRAIDCRHPVAGATKQRQPVREGNKNAKGDNITAEKGKYQWGRGGHGKLEFQWGRVVQCKRLISVQSRWLVQDGNCGGHGG